MVKRFFPSSTAISEREDVYLLGLLEDWGKLLVFCSTLHSLSLHQIDKYLVLR